MNSSEAMKLLKDSREKIDRIDDEIMDLIVERTSLASDIATAKRILNKNIEDSQREDLIQHKIAEIAKEKNIDELSLKNIMNILTELNKKEQEKFLRR